MVEYNAILSSRYQVKEVFSPSDIVQMMNLEFNERKGNACLSVEDMMFLEICNRWHPKKGWSL